MALEDYRIPWHPLDIATPLNAIRQRYRDRDADARAAEELQIKRDKIKNDERRLASEEYRRQREFEQSEQDRQDKAIASAKLMFKNGDRSGALMLLRQHGIHATPEMGAPAVYTPAMALAGADAQEAKRQAAQPPTGEPVAFEQSPAVPRMVTPMNAFARQGEHVGVSVPNEEMERRRAADNMDVVGTGLTPRTFIKIDEPLMIDDKPLAPEDMVGALPAPEQPQTMEPQVASQIGHGEPGHAVADLMGIEMPAKPTGAYTFRGKGGDVIGRHDPEEERQFRAERAERVKEMLGPLGEKYMRVADAFARGDITEQEMKTFVTVMSSEATAREKEAGKDRRQEDQQVHQALLAKLYRNEALTVQDRYNLARISASAKIAAAGGGPITPQEAELARLVEAGAGGGEVATRASEMGPKADIKHVTPLTQNIVKNALSAERVNEKRTGREINDASGKFLGYAHSTTQATQLKKQTDQFAQAKVRLEELIADIERTGSRVLSPKEIQQRLSKAQSVNAAMRVYNGLGATDASQRLEAEITGAIGTPGHGFWMGANKDVIRRILHEAELQHQTRLNTALVTGPGARPLAPSLGGPRTTSVSTSYSGPASGGTHWVKIPARLANDPQLQGKTEILIDTSGNALEAR